MNGQFPYSSTIDEFIYLILLFLSFIPILGPHSFDWILHLLNTNNITHIRPAIYLEIRIYIIFHF